MEITLLLSAWAAGDRGAFDELVTIIYPELRRLARLRLAREGRELAQTTELVNEAYLRLLDCNRVRWQDREHFFALAGTLMRRVLVDMARMSRAAKRGGEVIHVTLAEEVTAGPPDWIALDEALKSLEALDGRKGRMVELRFFAGLGVEETAKVLNISAETVHRDWKFARTWLRRELGGGEAA